MSYCSYIQIMTGAQKDLHKTYHDHHYGFPIHDDNELFGRLLMEINQAGLSWETILRKEKGFRLAYNNFSIDKVAAYGPADFDRLMNDPGIIRNRLKINAAIENARTIQGLQKNLVRLKSGLSFIIPKARRSGSKFSKRPFVSPAEKLSTNS